MRAVQFGAGNIGRGFVAPILHRAGYALTFVDVDAGLIAAINAAESFTVHEVGERPRDVVITDFDAIDSAADPQAAVAAVAGADVVTCAVGPNAMRFIAPVIRAGLEQRAAAAPLTIMAVENAIGASDTLRTLVLTDADPALADRARFANTAVDRIVPAQSPEGIDVTVEDFFEWVIDRTPFGDAAPRIPDAHMVDDLQPFIERKLFTVNTGHATTAYLGYRAGHAQIADALADSEIRAAVEAVLAETGRLIVSRFGVDPESHAAYAERVLRRFENPALPDSCERIGRDPLRKLGREDRLVRPAAALAEQGDVPTALVGAYRAALEFDPPGDEQAVRMQELLRTLSAEDFVTEVSGIRAEHPLQPLLVEAVRSRQSR